MSYTTKKAAKKSYPKKTHAQIVEEIQQQTTQMMTHVENYTTDPEKIKEVFDFMKEFPNYSFKNQQMIQSQFKEARAVASFKYFKDKGYFVKKGEKGIKIFAPTQIKSFQKDDGAWSKISLASDDEKQKIAQGKLQTKETTGFILTSVFDISQTNAPEDKIPELFPNKHISYTNGYPIELEDALHDLSRSMRITLLKTKVGSKDELGNAFGQFRHYKTAKGESVAKEIVLNHRNTPSENTKVLLHELAHAYLHSDTDKSKELKETEAELTSYVVAKHFDLDTSETSLKYIADWSNNGQHIKDKMAMLEDVSKTSSFFIAFLDQNIQSKTLKESQTQNVSQKV